MPNMRSLDNLGVLAVWQSFAIFGLVLRSDSESAESSQTTGSTRPLLIHLKG